MREIQFPEKDLPLRDDVRVLGALVGEMLAEQQGKHFLQLVEGVRKTAILRREEADSTCSQLNAFLSGMDVETAGRLVRAFTTYFLVVNLAEKVHRIRRRRDYLRRGERAQPGGLLAVMRELDSAGFEQVMKELGQMTIEPVMTAHPTESTRRTLLEKEQLILRMLVDRLNPSRTPDEETAALERIRAAVTSNWQTEMYPKHKLTVRNEMEHVLFYLTDVIYRIVPPFYESLRHALDSVWEHASDKPLPKLLHFGSWVGGDMDGNPNVTAKTIIETLVTQRRAVIHRYLPDVRRLGRYLSQTRPEAEFSADFEQRFADYSQRWPDVLKKMPHRQIGRAHV